MNRPKKYKKALWLQIREDSNPVKWADSSSKALANRPKSIRRRTPKREKEEREYRKRVKEWIKWRCCQSCSGIIHLTKATECHHKYGRQGKLLLWEDGWVALCKDCHQKVHQDIAWAKAAGLIAGLGQWNNQSLVPKNYYNP